MSQLTADFGLLDSNAGYNLLARTLIELRGEDRASFLHNLCTNDIKLLEHGAGCEAFLTNVQGKVLGHILVLCTADSLWIDTVADQAATLLPHLDKYLIREDVQLSDQSADWRHLLLAGKQVADWLAKLGLNVPEVPLTHQDAHIGQQAVRVFRVPFFADCISLHVTHAGVSAVIAELDGLGFQGFSDLCFDAKRIAAGFPLYGRDISSDNLPQEVGRDAESVSFTKGCYLGQETVARIDALGHVNRQLRRLKFECSLLPQAGCELSLESKVVGTVTSICESPAGILGLGYVRTAASESGSRLTLDGGVATVV